MSDTFNIVEVGEDGTGYSRLLVVANNLPLWNSEAGLDYHPTKIAGIAPALQKLKASGDISDFLFFGHIPSHKIEENIEDKLKKLECVAINTPQSVYDSYHGGFCKSSLWPLLHYRLQNVKHNEKWFESYVRVNEIFADTILSHCKPGDIIWIHDYHLMLLPSLLRERLPRGVPIGFFFHVPFPSSELFRVLPNRAELLVGILGSDLVGFQTFEYVRHFESSVSRLLGAECSARGVESPSSSGHFVRVDVCPGGLDVETFDKITTGDAIKARHDHLKTLFKDKHLLVSKDRVDEIEGVPLKLHAMETFFNKYPQWKGKVVLFQIYEPPETENESEDVKALQREVNEMVGRLNGMFGAVDYVPIEYENKSLPLEEVCALYSVAQVALVTPLRDGLNLVSHEYVVCQKWESPGLLVLSEFTGAASCLSGSRLVNPYDQNDFADAIHEALSTSEEDRIAKHEYDYEYVRANTSTVWAKHFFDELKVSVSLLINHAPVPLLDIGMVGCAYSRSNKDRLFLLDCDGTLVKHPKLAMSSTQVLGTLEKLSSNPRNKVYLISGRDWQSLDSWVGHLNVGMACEHGAFLRPWNTKEWMRMATNGDTLWKTVITSVMEDFADRTPGSFVEPKAVNAAWHYRNSDPEYGSFMARELMHELTAVACKFSVDVILGKKCIEVKPKEIGKGEITKKILEQHPNVDFVFCVGGDKPDEEMFAQFLSPCLSHFTCCVMTDTKRTTQAKYWVESDNDVLDILNQMVALDVKLSKATTPTTTTSLSQKFLALPVPVQLRRNSLLGIVLREKKNLPPIIAQAQQVQQ